MKLYLGDCLQVMKDFARDSIDAIVTDPPYGISFMEKHWDYGIPGMDFWAEALRVAKPGCHLLAFGGTRTFHRLTCAIEDAGWEIRDCLMWVYGSGFPKSLDVSKAIDKAAGAKRKIIGIKPGHEEFANRGNLSSVQSFNSTGGGGFSRPWMQESEKVEAYHHQTAPTTDSARRWQGWGTALKPAWEPIILARKPVIGTVADNVQKYGTGAMNIDGCRVNGDMKGANFGGSNKTCQDGRIFNGSPDGEWYKSKPHTQGRFPANLIHDGSEEVMEGFPSNERSTKPSRTGGHFNATGAFPIDSEPIRHTDNGGSAARFFYCAKASKADRNEGCEFLPLGEAPASARSKPAEGRQNALGNPRSNHHPTVKPTALMRYLCRLITPPQGIILDPFMGSGSTGVAALSIGFDFVGIEKEEEYLKIAEKRISETKPASTFEEMKLL